MSDSEREYRELAVAVESATPAVLTERLDAGEDVSVLDVRDRDEVEARAVDEEAPGLEPGPTNPAAAAAD